VTGANLGQPLALLMLNPEAAAKARDAAGRSALEASLAEHLKSGQRHSSTRTSRWTAWW
jgi:long-chain acyl-CoA synthetase